MATTVTVGPAEFNIEAYQGDTIVFTVTLRQETDSATWADPNTPEYEPVDLTGATFEAQVRPRPGASSLWATFTIEAVDLPQGQVRLVLPADESANIRRNAQWDLEVTFPDGTVRTLLYGAVMLTKQVTP